MAERRPLLNTKNKTNYKTNSKTNSKTKFKTNSKTTDSTKARQQQVSTQPLSLPPGSNTTPTSPTHHNNISNFQADSQWQRAWTVLKEGEGARSPFLGILGLVIYLVGLFGVISNMIYGKEGMPYKLAAKLEAYLFDQPDTTSAFNDSAP